MKKATIGMAGAALLFGLGAMPASAGKLPSTVVVDPEVVEQGATTVISNSDDGASQCDPVQVQLPLNGPAANTSSQVRIEIEDPEGEAIAKVLVIPDDDGDWSYETDSLEAVGEYTVWASCEFQGGGADLGPAQNPAFDYAVATFEVIAQAPTSSTTAAPTTTTTAATAAVTATPHYTG